ncbi:endonuclease Q family protein [Methanofollis formosanus]|uniref:Endonuclease Q family protein n=1 Tax=Methanofollis formosanus TaxID=299308 RepID=A0A8G0ZZF8_9EURY|nr:endonuclease Q family protein [Methanofollis formosanus]QYZ78799.1 endonuclease Q family protein [Methanofollis formosanus]
MAVYADLHIHSPFSMATSPSMTPAALCDAAALKGVGVLGSGDALHPEWRAAWERYEDGTGTVVLPTTEVEGKGRVHHLIVMEDFSCFEELAAVFAPHSRDLLTGGRPHVRLGGETIAAAVHDLGGLVGPAHAFTPWTSLYASHDSVASCYGEEPIDFLELGLSADTSYGAGIPELDGVPFLSNSDAHSAHPVKLGREFNRLDLGTVTPKAAFDAVKRGKVTLNAGFFPEEGKYNRTACTRCYRQYTLEEAEAHAWTCPIDGGKIKKGVQNRAHELGGGGDRSGRPPYYHIIPLGEIIRVVLGVSSPTTRKVEARYARLTDAFETEIAVLAEVPPEEIAEVDLEVGDAIAAFRDGRVNLVPGGGGKYGTFSFL